MATKVKCSRCDCYWDSDYLEACPLCNTANSGPQPPNAVENLDIPSFLRKWPDNAMPQVAGGTQENTPKVCSEPAGVAPQAQGMPEEPTRLFWSTIGMKDDDSENMCLKFVDAKHYETLRAYAERLEAELTAAGRPCDTCGGRYPNLDDKAECPKCFAEMEQQRLEAELKQSHDPLLEIHRLVHSWADAPVVNERDQWTVKRVKELLLEYQRLSRREAYINRYGKPPEFEPR